MLLTGLNNMQLNNYLKF